jgi:hypothetical protein
LFLKFALETYPDFFNIFTTRYPWIRKDQALLLHWTGLILHTSFSGGHIPPAFLHVNRNLVYVVKNMPPPLHSRSFIIYLNLPVFLTDAMDAASCQNGTGMMGVLFLI